VKPFSINWYLFYQIKIKKHTQNFYLSKELVEQALQKEEERFIQTLDTGMGILESAIEAISGMKLVVIVAFKLYDTYGFPVDLTADVARESGLED